MIQHTCGTTVPATIDAFVRHLAACTETDAGVAIVSQGIVSRVDEIAALDETQPVSVDVSPAVSRDSTATWAVPSELTPARMAELHDGGVASLRDMAAVVRVAPETVRRRIAKHKAGGES